jgi:hypothetical protein
MGILLIWISSRLVLIRYSIFCRHQKNNNLAVVQLQFTIVCLQSCMLWIGMLQLSTSGILRFVEQYSDLMYDGIKLIDKNRDVT